MGEQTYTTKVGIGLDPAWEETTEFTVEDPATQKVEGTFYVKCEKNGNEQQLGDILPIEVAENDFKFENAKDAK